MTARKALSRKRNSVYSTRQDADANSVVFKRRRAAIYQESTPDDSSSGGGRQKRSAKVRALKAIAAYDEGTDSSSDSRDDSEPLVSLRQSIDPEDIERIKKQNSRGLRSIGDLLESCESSMDDWNVPAQGHKTRDQTLRKAEIRQEYREKYALPPVLYRSDLIARVQPLLRLVKDLFKNRIASYYKHEATDAFKTSSNAILSLDEFRSMDIGRFMAGYYGLKRQLSVGEEILRQFKPFLIKRQGKTMKWWGVADFANYVLAPEVLASLCIQEMALGDDIYDRETREKAYDIFHNTTEFGLAVADAEPLEKWEVPLPQHQAEPSDPS